MLSYTCIKDKEKHLTNNYFSPILNHVIHKTKEREQHHGNQGKRRSKKRHKLH